MSQLHVWIMARERIPHDTVGKLVEVICSRCMPYPLAFLIEATRFCALRRILCISCGSVGPCSGRLKG